jgi:hypothetical protein
VIQYIRLIVKNSNSIASFVTDLANQIKRERVLSSLVPAHSGLPNMSSPQQRDNGPDRTNAIFSPEDARPFPKAGQRNISNREKKRKKEAILIDTPKNEP